MRRVSSENHKVGALIRDAISVKLETGKLDTKAKKAQAYGHRKPYSMSYPNDEDESDEKEDQ